uniref:Uncharacterized protein n=1 Tax=Paramormyrops kingsleyae TaxID=1676925 RepID=A0A3B3QB61_9TELE
MRQEFQRGQVATKKNTRLFKVSKEMVSKIMTAYAKSRQTASVKRDRASKIGTDLKQHVSELQKAAISGTAAIYNPVLSESSAQRRITWYNGQRKRFPPPEQPWLPPPAPQRPP